MQHDLDELRARINKLDQELVRILNERAKVAVQIGQVKASTDEAIYDPSRERAVLERIDLLNAGPLGKGAIEEIFASIMTACREIQIR